MPRDYEREYSEDASDYKRKRRNVDESDGGNTMGGGNGDGQEHNASGHHHHHHHESASLNEKTNEYLQECLQEQKAVEKKYPICKRLLDVEIEKVLVSGRIPKPELYANVYNEKPIRVAQKVLFPIKEYPKFNFVGKILGPKGNTLRQLQEDTFCKMVIMGRNSMRDHVKEEQLRNSGDCKYAHLSRDLHIEISTVAPPSEAFHRLAYALTEVRKYMIPDANDDIRLEQMREIDGKDRMYKKSHYNNKQYGHSNYGSRSREQMYDHHAGEYDRYTTPPPPPPKHSVSHHSGYEGDYRREYHHPHSSSYTSTYPAKPSNGRSSSSYRATASGSHSSSHYESGSRSRESVRYRSAPYPKMR